MICIAQITLKQVHNALSVNDRGLVFLDTQGLWQFFACKDGLNVYIDLGSQRIDISAYAGSWSLIFKRQYYVNRWVSWRQRVYFFIWFLAERIYVGINQSFRIAGVDPGIFDWGVQTLVQKGLLYSFEANYFPPPLPSHQSRLYVIITWPLTVYLDSTRKGYTLGTS